MVEGRARAVAQRVILHHAKIARHPLGVIHRGNDGLQRFAGHERV